MQAKKSVRSKTKKSSAGAGKSKTTSVAKKKTTAGKAPAGKATRRPKPAPVENKPVVLRDAERERRDAAKKLALAIAYAAYEKKAEGLQVVDLAGKVDYADYLVLASGRADRQVVAIAQGIEEAMEKTGVRKRSSEGLSEGQWVLLDYGDVIVHIFLQEARSYYDLDGLWMDAARVPLPFVQEESTKLSPR